MKPGDDRTTEHDVWREDPQSPGLRRGKLLLEFKSVGEGYDGDYDAGNPKDENLLRFYIRFVFDDVGKDVEDADCGSACTLIPASTSPQTLKRLLLLLMNRVEASIGDEPIDRDTECGLPCKKVAWESLSWIDPSWVAT